VAGLGGRASSDDDDVDDQKEVAILPSPSASAAACTAQSGYRPLSASSGYVAALNTDDLGCPWVVRASPGQRITVVAYDFAWPPAVAPPGGWPDLSGPGCPVFASLEERGPPGGGGRAVRLCEVRHRRTVVYSSLGHELVVRLQSAQLNVTAARRQRLFLHYEGARAANETNKHTHTVTHSHNIGWRRGVVVSGVRQ